MSEFKIDEEQIRKFRRRFLAIYVPFAVIAFTIIVVFVTNLYQTDHLDSPIWALLALLFPAYFSFSIYRTLWRQQRLMKSYTITIEDGAITRKQENTQTISISFMEIKEIIMTPKGGFLIKGLNRTDLIAIPLWLNKTGELEQELKTLAPITVEKRDPTKLIRYRSLLVLLAVGMYVCLYSVPNKIVTAASALVLTGVLGWSLYEIQISKNVTTYRKRSSWIYLLLIAGILYLTYIKLTLPVF